jgi:hypothetical protein
MAGGRGSGLAPRTYTHEKSPARAGLLRERTLVVQFFLGMRTGQFSDFLLYAAKLVGDVLTAGLNLRNPAVEAGFRSVYMGGCRDMSWHDDYSGSMSFAMNVETGEINFLDGQFSRCPDEIEPSDEQSERVA